MRKRYRAFKYLKSSVSWFWQLLWIVLQAVVGWILRRGK